VIKSAQETQENYASKKQKYASASHKTDASSHCVRFFMQRTQAPADRNGRSKQPIMVASASACVFRLRNARIASDCVRAFKWKPGFSVMQIYSHTHVRTHDHLSRRTWVNWVDSAFASCLTLPCPSQIGKGGEGNSVPLWIMKMKKLHQKKLQNIKYTDNDPSVLCYHWLNDRKGLQLVKNTTHATAAWYPL